jgi:hypothetical protein
VKSKVFPQRTLIIILAGKNVIDDGEMEAGWH